MYTRIFDTQRQILMRDINNTDTNENETKRKKTMNRILINLAQLTRL